MLINDVCVICLFLHLLKKMCIPVCTRNRDWDFKKNYKRKRFEKIQDIFSRVLSSQESDNCCHVYNGATQSSHSSLDR